MYNDLLKEKFSSWEELEKKIEALPSAPLKGEVFEQFIFAYLSIKKQFYQLKEVYRSKEIPKNLLEKYKLEKKDSGVDGLVVFNDGKVAGYQVKFRTNRLKPSYDELAKFWVESQHTDYNYTIANCYSITDLVLKQQKHLQILVDEFESLNQDFFEELYKFTNDAGKIERFFYTPFSFQEEIIKDVCEGFKTNSKGKLISACGTGKTLTALWITEELESGKVLFLAPSLALIKQTLEAWADQTKAPFTYMCVCSDKTVSSEIEDMGDISIKDFNIPVTTNSVEISSFLETKVEGRKIIFSTYQSLPVLLEGVKLASNFKFDLAIFDEAHRTAGTNDTSIFNLALRDNGIPSNKKLFMTATERLVKPSLKKKAEEFDRVVFSMDDEAVYGPVFHRYDFGDAIRDGVISDYKIILAGIQEKEVYDWIKQNKDVGLSQDSEEFRTGAFTLFTQILLAKAIKEYPIRKVISFHSSIKNAQLFTTGISHTLPLIDVITKIDKNVPSDEVFISHINSSISTGDRKEILDVFKNSKYGVVSNARCLTEGVDVPVIDSVYFVEPKSSLIDIVQACGRALRKPLKSEKEVAFFIIPILIPESTDGGDIFNLPGFETLFNLIQSLRDQDSRLEEWIEELNKEAVKGKSPKYSKTTWKPVNISLPHNIDIAGFEEKMYLKIAEVNANPTKLSYATPKTYGKRERKSDYKRIFKTLGDCSTTHYEETLVLPTISKFTKADQKLEKTELQIVHNGNVSHNNISHTQRLGLITKVDKFYQLTPLGVQYWNKEVDFKTLFKKQMLRYSEVTEENSETRTLFPYRTCLKILLEVKSINFIEFAFALYTLYDSSDENIREAIENIKYLRENYPNLKLTSEANKKHVLEELNSYFGTSFKEADIWSKKTTINNQFIYFRDHISLFDDFIEVDTQKAEIKDGCEHKGHSYLSTDNQLEYDKNPDSRFLKYVSTFITVIVFSLLR
jgi:superfamily II DNA or RNA helicase